MKIDENETFRLLELEYARLQESIDKFDDNRFKIKGWSITIAGALVALGVNTNEEVQLFIVAALLVLFFAFMESLYMSMQAQVIDRSNEIEELLELARREGIVAAHDSYIFGIGKVFKRRHTFRRLRQRPHLVMFYSGMIAVLTCGAIIVA
jgi:non-ribosomal peptide synthetase component E (peptide arylation enzyme)